MKHIKLFEAVNPIRSNAYAKSMIDNERVKMTMSEFDDILKLLDESKSFIGSRCYNNFIKIKQSSPNTNWIFVDNKSMDEFNKIKELVNESEFIEDCLIDLYDNNNYIVRIRPIVKQIIIDFKSLNDIQLILNVLNQNRLRFKSDLHSINSDDDDDSFHGPLPAANDFTFTIQYMILK